MDVVSTGCSMTLHSMGNAIISTSAGSGFELTATVGHHIGTATGLRGGNISADKSFAADGEAVTLTVTPDEGYTIGTVTYNDGSEHVIEPVDNIYTFSTTASSTASTVNVTAKFRKALTHMDISIEEIPSQTYTGSALTPVVIVKDGTKTLKEDTDYTISPKTYTDAGEHSITITGIGNYSSVVEKTFVLF